MKTIGSWISKIAQWLVKAIALGLIYGYRWIVSPILHTLAGPGMGCRFQPTCSEYALTAIQRFGAWRGSLLAIRRISRCHPWGGSGWDPVPDEPGTENHCHKQERPCTKPHKKPRILVSQNRGATGRFISSEVQSVTGNREENHQNG